MFNFDLDYFLLNMMLLLTFIIAGNKVSFGKNGKKYIWACIFVFTFVLGSRYLRGNDYIRYQQTFLYDDDESQVIFTGLNRFLRGIGVDKYHFLYLYSIPFVTCALVFLQKLKPYACYLFPMFLMSFIFFDEYCIRQALGFSFLFMYMYHLFDVEEKNLAGKKSGWNRWLWCIFYAMLSCGIHSVNAMSVIIVTCVYVVSFRPLPWKVTVPLYLFSSFFLVSFFDWSYFENALILIGGASDKFSTYVDRSNQFFSSDAFLEDYSRSFMGQCFAALGHCSLFYLGNKTISQRCGNRMFYTLFNVYVIGTIFDVGFWNYELIRRVFDPMHSFWCFIFPIVLVHRREVTYWFHEKILLYILFLPFLRDYLAYLLQRGDMTLFIWDM